MSERFGVCSCRSLETRDARLNLHFRSLLRGRISSNVFAQGSGNIYTKQLSLAVWRASESIQTGYPCNDSQSSTRHCPVTIRRANRRFGLDIGAANMRSVLLATELLALGTDPR